MWHWESHACVACSEIDSFESGECTECTRAIPSNDVKKEHYLCKKCADGWFPMANKTDCMEPLEHCDYDLEEYEIYNKVYVCPHCDLGYYWDVNAHECQECTVDGCVECSRLGEECLKCEPGMLPQIGGLECVNEIGNCEIHGVWRKDDEDVLACNKCMPNFFWNDEDWECSETEVDNCDIAVDISTCHTCATGFYLEFGGKECKEYPLNCYRNPDTPIASSLNLVLGSDDEFECAQCNLGFRWDEESKECIACSPGCWKCDDTKCLECENFKEVIGGICKEDNGIDYCVQANP